MKPFSKSFLSRTFLIIALAIQTKCYCQEQHNDIVRKRRLVSEIEALIGIQFSKPITDAYRPAFKQLLGISANLGAIHNFSEHLSLSLNLQYESKGMKQEFDQLIEDGIQPVIWHIKGITNINYISGTLMPRYQPISRWPLFLGIGPYFAWVVSEKVSTDISINGVVARTGGGRPLPGDFKDYDYGVSAMAGYNVSLKDKLQITFRATYNRGFPIYSSDQFVEYQSSSISIQAGIVIPKTLHVNL
ncbi:outer membrane beta-barrel protein [Chryseolinea sp. T2]|uniref:outer membrane beta-barrel protein n=1 Tax=Chryseolinea sp. T2 TaxID=3129255 RepID=UPI0030787278